MEEEVLNKDAIIGIFITLIVIAVIINVIVLVVFIWPDSHHGFIRSVHQWLTICSTDQSSMDVLTSSKRRLVVTCCVSHVLTACLHHGLVTYLYQSRDGYLAPPVTCATAVTSELSAFLFPTFTRLVMVAIVIAEIQKMTSVRDIKQAKVTYVLMIMAGVYVCGVVIPVFFLLFLQHPTEPCYPGMTVLWYTSNSWKGHVMPVVSYVIPVVMLVIVTCVLIVTYYMNCAAHTSSDNETKMVDFPYDSVIGAVVVAVSEVLFCVRQFLYWSQVDHTVVSKAQWVYLWVADRLLSLLALTFLTLCWCFVPCLCKMLRHSSSASVADKVDELKVKNNHTDSGFRNNHMHEEPKQNHYIHEGLNHYMHEEPKRFGNAINGSKRNRYMLDGPKRKHNTPAATEQEDAYPNKFDESEDYHENYVSSAQERRRKWSLGSEEDWKLSSYHQQNTSHRRGSFSEWSEATDRDSDQRNGLEWSADKRGETKQRGVPMSKWNHEEHRVIGQRGMPVFERHDERQEETQQRRIPVSERSNRNQQDSGQRSYTEGWGRENTRDRRDEWRDKRRPEPQRYLTYMAEDTEPIPDMVHSFNNPQRTPRYPTSERQFDSRTSPEEVYHNSPNLTAETQFSNRTPPKERHDNYRNLISEPRASNRTPSQNPQSNDWNQASDSNHKNPTAESQNYNKNQSGKPIPKQRSSLRKSFLNRSHLSAEVQQNYGNSSGNQNTAPQPRNFPLKQQPNPRDQAVDPQSRNLSRKPQPNYRNPEDEPPYDRNPSSEPRPSERNSQRKPPLAQRNPAVEAYPTNRNLSRNPLEMHRNPPADPQSIYYGQDSHSPPSQASQQTENSRSQSHDQGQRRMVSTHGSHFNSQNQARSAEKPNTMVYNPNRESYFHNNKQTNASESGHYTGNRSYPQNVDSDQLTLNRESGHLRANSMTGNEGQAHVQNDAFVRVRLAGNGRGVLSSSDRRDELGSNYVESHC